LINIYIYIYEDFNFHARSYESDLTGISEVVERNIGVFRQQGNVELEVCNLAEEIFGTGIICESLEQ
jgi:hypothetical protein